MPKLSPTKTTIDAIPHPQSGQRLYWRSSLRGFGLLVGKQTKSFVVDGGMLRQGDRRARLLGIDAPELGQTCRLDKVVTLCGRDAKDALSRSIVGGVRCEVERHDRWKRDLAVCFNSQGFDVGQALIEQRWAVPCKYAPRYTREYAEAWKAG